tara:strand:+ start:317 stop:661 length:345 start_codon:yes stop_codon:yes gene_type:complete
MVSQKVDAFQFLSKYHHQLHILIGEEKGDVEEAFNEIVVALSSNNNPELLPIKEAVRRVDEINKNSDSVKRLDFLVDYYQSGLSMQVEGIMRGYGYLDSFSLEDAMNIYDSLQK